MTGSTFLTCAAAAVVASSLMIQPAEAGIFDWIFGRNNGNETEVAVERVRGNDTDGGFPPSRPRRVPPFDESDDEFMPPPPPFEPGMVYYFETDTANDSASCEEDFDVAEAEGEVFEGHFMFDNTFLMEVFESTKQISICEVMEIGNDQRFFKYFSGTVQPMFTVVGDDGRPVFNRPPPRRRRNRQ